ncbi:tripartite tricarboxylate transporter substrate-binding protein [Variovorax sp. J22P168]|uniref:Bug family tripartite tricarboxylate transporter substrate binding protein n=1 Tax=Variovorax jilinensis TaxID=3053513 RepID=UPI002578E4CE|nr:tripartite tricarboxylate transporter substrate-binding protein [Variovorax sp. J22P168]MDM0015177.1 tripartite tricarboxylate transporter substrate-binding protein [Variovorax sp. J22P168]
MKILSCTVVLALGAGICLQAAAQGSATSFPAKPVRIIVPFAPGGGIDVLTRALGPRLTARWGQPIVVENKPGAGSLIGTQYVAQSPADGYTLLATVNQTMVGNRYLYKKLPYDPDKSFDPITLMVQADQLVVAHVGFPANTLREAVEIARAKPGTVNYGSFGNGSQPHLLFSLVNEREKVDLTHIPYNGITPNLTALAAGDVQLGTGSAAVVAPFVASGKVKPLAVAGDSVIAQYPRVSTTSQQGLPYAKISIWYGLFAPAGTPAEVLNEIRAAVQAALADPEFAQQQVVSKGLAVVAGDGKQLREAIAREVESTAVMVKAAGVVAE